MSDYLMKAYAPQPVAFSRGDGAWLYDSNNKKYLDFLAGIAVVNLGHNHPKVTQTIQTQAAKLMQVSNGFVIPEQEKLAETLCTLTGLDNAFFCSTGAEANECAIKIARAAGHNRGIETPVIISMEKSFHGRTMAAISATGNQKVRTGFDPLLEGFTHCPYNDIDALKALSNNKNVVAVMLEPIQGEGGINIPDAHYLSAVRALCDQNNWLLILDEIQTGVGRTGKLFAYQHHNILPDILTSAKGLGNGYPVAACLAKGEAAQVFKPGMHGTTFGGSPMASAVAQTVIDTITQDGIIDHVNTIAPYLLQCLQSELGQLSSVVEIRNQGLMIGIELDHACGALRKTGLDAGLVFNVTADKVIRLVPPLIIDQQQCEQMATGLKQLIDN